MLIENLTNVTQPESNLYNSNWNCCCALWHKFTLLRIMPTEEPEVMSKGVLDVGTAETSGLWWFVINLAKWSERWS